MLAERLQSRARTPVDRWRFRSLSGDLLSRARPGMLGYGVGDGWRPPVRYKVCLRGQSSRNSFGEGGHRGRHDSDLRGTAFTRQSGSVLEWG